MDTRKMLINEKTTLHRKITTMILPLALKKSEWKNKNIKVDTAGITPFHKCSSTQ